MLLTDPEHRYKLIAALNKAGGEAQCGQKMIFEGAEGWPVKP
jgi:hypothetical protein